MRSDCESCSINLHVFWLLKDILLVLDIRGQIKKKVTHSDTWSVHMFQVEVSAILSALGFSLFPEDLKLHSRVMRVSGGDVIQWGAF